MPHIGSVGAPDSRSRRRLDIHTDPSSSGPAQVKVIMLFLLSCYWSPSPRYAVHDGQTVARPYPGLAAALRSVVGSEGVRGLYAGVTPNLGERGVVV